MRHGGKVHQWQVALVNEGSRFLNTSAGRQHQRSVLVSIPSLFSPPRQLVGHCMKQNAGLGGPLVWPSKPYLCFYVLKGHQWKQLCCAFLSWIFLTLYLPVYFTDSQYYISNTREVFDPYFTHHNPPVKQMPTLLAPQITDALEFLPTAVSRTRIPGTGECWATSQ